MVIFIVDKNNNIMKKLFKILFNNAKVSYKRLTSLNDNSKIITTIKQVKSNGTTTIEVIANPKIIKIL